MPEGLFLLREEEGDGREPSSLQADLRQKEAEGFLTLGNSDADGVCKYNSSTGSLTPRRRKLLRVSHKDCHRVRECAAWQKARRSRSWPNSSSFPATRYPDAPAHRPRSRALPFSDDLRRECSMRYHLHNPWLSDSGVIPFPARHRTKIDPSLRRYMLEVYDYVACGLGVTGLAAYVVTYSGFRAPMMEHTPPVLLPFVC